MGGVAIHAIGLAGNDDADRRLLAFHGADLHRARMGAQDPPLAVLVRIEEERVVHLASRVAFGEIQRGEVVVVGLDIWTFGNGESHIGEDGGDFVDDLADRVDAAALRRSGAHGKRDVHLFLFKAHSDCGILECALARGQRFGNAIL